MNRKKQIDEIIDSINSIDPVQPRDRVLDEIMMRIKTGKRAIELMPMRTVSMAAASILLLILANIYFVVQDKKAPVALQHEDAMQSVISYYGLSEQGTILGL
ncbi:MAG: hypothetical protein EOP56_09715 [Sphingobacteriales bacterium]|nr:MAG: hypothetical protein EOP56_09715 [Sphingobacteriales bacterium]